MPKFALLFAAFVGAFISLAHPKANASSVERYCYEPAQTPPRYPTIIGSAQKTDQISAIFRNRALEEKVIRVRHSNDHPGALFVYFPILSGDCFLFNPAEKTQLTVIEDSTVGYQPYESFWQMVKRFGSEIIQHFKRGESQDLIPVVLFSKKFGSKSFGWLPAQDLNQFKRDLNYREATVEDLQNLDVLGSLTLIYLICPSDRSEVCTLSIKKNGDWIKDAKGERILFQVLARSMRKALEPSTRIVSEGDAPQGIYYLWATMFSEDPAYGKVPRVDIDAALPPINGWSYTLHPVTLSEILAPEMWDQYWVNEWPLAYALGRNLLRVHADSILKQPSYIYVTPKTQISFAEGCINLGEHMPAFLSTLAKLGVFDEQDTHPIPNPDSKTLEWKVSPALGRAFLIVKDTRP